MNPITLAIAEVKPALSGLSKVINKRSTLPVLSHVRVERTAAGQVELSVTDLDQSLTAKIETPSQGEPLAVLVPFEELQHVTKGCRTGDTLLIVPLAPQRVALKFPVGGEMIEHRCDSLPAAEFPPISEIRGEPVIVDGNLRQAINQALQCASIDETRLVLNGAYLDVSKSQGHYVVGTDGRHLYSSNSFVFPLSESLIIPGHRFLEGKEFHGEGEWTLRVARPEKEGVQQFELSSSRWRFVARSFDGDYPNWRQVQLASDSFKTTVDFDPRGVERVLQLLAKLPDPDRINHGIRLEIKGVEMHLAARSSNDDEWRRVKVECALANGADVVVHLNRQLLAKALRFELLKLEIVDGRSPVRFIASKRQMIVMPVRPDAPDQDAPNTASNSATIAPEPTSSPSAIAETPNEATVSESTDSPKVSTPEVTPEPERSALESALAQIEVVRGEFRNVNAGLIKLADSLRQAQREQKSGLKEIQSVRQTLRSLQSVRI